MAKINIIRPLDQPIGRHRLLNDLETGLESSEYEEFLIIVAYARIGPLYKLSEHLKKWHIAGKKSKVIFGIDQKLTSYEALEFALHIFDEVYITQNIHTTFHPKIYMFIGKSKVRAIIGSNNLTIGGTETNFESAVDLELDTNTDSPFIEQLRQLWAELMPDSCPASQALDTTLLSQLQNELIVLSERNKLSNNPAFTSSGLRKQHSILHIKPPSSLPQDIPPVTRIDGANDRFIEGLSKIELISTGLIIQIKPHHNGEIFLSTTAVLQHPAFFSWPFTGQTIPKKLGNPAYPQRVPDPIVNIIVYGASPSPILSLSSYKLNTIYYSTKHEIRITASPLVGIVPEYSVMIMEASQKPDIDYDITIYTPDSPSYGTWLAACNQEMPGGGKSPRKFGWI